MLTIKEVEQHFANNVFPRLGRQYEWMSSTDQYVRQMRKDGRGVDEPIPEWVKQDSPWRNHFEVAEYNRHNGCINNFWTPTIKGNNITEWTKRPGKGHTLEIWI